MKLSATFLTLAAARDLAMGSQSGNLVNGDESMGAGVTSHADDQFNQLSKAPTPAPKVGEAAFKALHYDTTATEAVPTNWEITSGNDCTLFTDADGHCVTDNGSTLGGLKCSRNGRWYRYNSHPAGASTTTSCWGGRWQAKSFTTGTTYGNNHQCSFKYTGDATLTVQEFQIETWWDWMKVNSRYYDSSNPLASSFAVSGTTNFEFRSDSWVTKEGFKICEPESTKVVTTSSAEEVGNTDQIDEQDALDNMPTAKPTAFPTKMTDSKTVNDGIAEWKVTSGDDCHIVLSSDGECVQDDKQDNSNYGNDEKCTFEYIGQGGMVTNERFDIETWYDSLTVGGMNYDNQNPFPKSMYISPNTEFKFSTDWWVTKKGFKLCVPKGRNFGSACEAKYRTESGAQMTFKRPVGWVGAGPGKDYCNIWKCDANMDKFTKGTFKAQKKTCSVEEHPGKFCSHTSCTYEAAVATASPGWEVTNGADCHASVTNGNYCIHDQPNPNADENYQNNEGCAFKWAGAGTVTMENKLFDIEQNSGCTWDDLTFRGQKYCGNNFPSSVEITSADTFTFKTDFMVTRKGFKFCVKAPTGPKVIKVHSDHREEVGGFHKCGFSQHKKARTDGRPACDCVCTGARRQDAADFTRTLASLRAVANTHDGTTDHNSWDTANNANNFYSQHQNIDATDKQGAFANKNANTNSKGDGSTQNKKFVSENNAYTQYNENDQAYAGQRVAHRHVDN